MYTYKGSKSHRLEEKLLIFFFRNDMLEHCDFPWMVNFSVLQVSLIATFSLVGLWCLRWIKPRFFPQHAVHTTHVKQGSTEQWLLFWEVISQAASTTVEDQEVRTGGDHVTGTCPREYIFLQDLARLEALLQRQQGEKEEKGWWRSVPMGRGSQLLCRNPAPPMEWKGNFSSSALRESPGVNRHNNLALVGSSQVKFCLVLSTEVWNAFPRYAANYS